jgi:predicted ATPase
MPSRPRLQALLEKVCAHATSTIVVAGGIGKTTLAIDFAEKSGRAVAVQLMPQKANCASSSNI